MNKTAMQMETRRFPDDGEIPNNPALPLVVMRGSGVVAEDDPAGWFEERFAANGWAAAWRWGIYPYHHFHTTNHEVLGVVCGEARVLFGGGKGEEFHIRLGNVIVIPAGVAHKCLESSDDFLVVGAYPRGEKPDLLETSTDREARDRIARVPLPENDPLHGPDGPLFDHWKSGDAL